MGSIHGQTIARRRKPTYYRPPKPKGAVSVDSDTNVTIKPKKHPRRREEGIQMRVCNYLRREYPDVIFMSDSAAGADLSDTARMKMMAMRSDDGMADLLILQPSREYHGLMLELKDEGTKVYKKDGKTLRKQSYRRKYWRGGKPFFKSGDHLQEQADMIIKYRSKGYMACFAIGYADACHKIDKYLDRQQSLSVF